MRKVTRFQTSDGRLYETHERAVRYADERYGNALTALTNRLLNYATFNLKTKRVDAFIDENLKDFVALQVLKDDIVLEGEEDEDD